MRSRRVQNAITILQWLGLAVSWTLLCWCLWEFFTGVE